MNGKTHCFVATLAMACLDWPERRILYPRWFGIDAGATLSDEFRIMWEYDDVKGGKRSLVHRCFIDSEDAKDHGCVVRAWDHAEGSVSFIQDYLAGDLSDSYTEDSFLENLGMFLGIISHHISDLCTPVHVGHVIDYERLAFRSWKRFHARVERDIEKHSRRAQLTMSPARKVKLSKKYFWRIAQRTYETAFVQLQSVYDEKDEARLLELVSSCISRAVMHTRDVWHTVLARTRMTQREWSLQPLL